MKLLKSMFISTYMMFLMILTGLAGWMLRSGSLPLAWGGVLLTTVPLLLVIGWLMMFRNVARTSAHFPLVNLLCALGAGLAGWGWRTGGAGSLPVVLATGAWLGFLLYAYWFSHLDRPVTSRLAVGSGLPGFTVKDTRGTPVRSVQLTDKPAILLFFRGNWCPLCMAQIKELAGRHEDFAALGIRVALISPQPQANNQALARKFDVGFEFLTDEGNSAARALGIADRHGLPFGMQLLGYASETVLPTVIITNPSGKVLWTHETDNYRIRPEPDTYLAVLRRHRLASELA